MDTKATSATWVPSERGRLDVTRTWLGQRAAGSVLEVGCGNGVNFPFFQRSVVLTAVDIKASRVDAARARAATLRTGPQRVEVRRGDAHRLDFADGAFDTVVCAFALCTIPDMERALREMVRVLRPGGMVLLADHIGSDTRWVRTLQRAAEAVSVPLSGEHFTRRPSLLLEALPVTIVERERVGGGGLERLRAHTPER